MLRKLLAHTPGRQITMQEENNIPPDIKDITLDSNDTISQIFDKILKRILLALSKPSVTAFINGMFSESFPLDSEITYHTG